MEWVAKDFQIKQDFFFLKKNPDEKYFCLSERLFFLACYLTMDGDLCVCADMY